MGSYIDRDELLKLYANTDELDISNYDVKVAIIRQNILDMPTIDIVRCGECKYYHGHEQYCEIDHFARENGFCYDGKRREDMSDIEREQRLIEFLKSLPIEKRALVVQAYVQEFGGVSIETGDIVKQLLKGERPVEK